MRKILFLAGLMFIGAMTISALSSEDSGAIPGKRVGTPAFYAKVATMTDCAELQESFDNAVVTNKRPGGPPVQLSPGQPFYQEKYGNWRQIGLAYMEAINARMKEVACYE